MYKVKRFSKSKRKESTRDKVYGTGIGLSGLTAAAAASNSMELNELARNNTKAFKAYRNESSKANEFIRQEIKSGGNRWKGPLGQAQAKSDKAALNSLKDLTKLHLISAKKNRNMAKASGKVAVGAGLTTAGLIGARYAHDKLAKKKEQ